MKEIEKYIETDHAVTPATASRLSKSVHAFCGDKDVCTTINGRIYERENGKWIHVKRRINPEWREKFHVICIADAHGPEVRTVYCRIQNNKFPWRKVVCPALNRLCKKVYGRPTHGEGIVLEMVDSAIFRKSKKRPSFNFCASSGEFVPTL